RADVETQSVAPRQKGCQRGGEILPEAHDGGIGLIVETTGLERAHETPDPGGDLLRHRRIDRLPGLLVDVSLVGHRTRTPSWRVRRERTVFPRSFRQPGRQY